MRAYDYVGPRDLLALLARPSERTAVVKASDALDWIKRSGQHLQRESGITATFIVDLNGRLWINDRHSEHLVCAAGQPVLSAGEMTLAVKGDRVQVVEATNQSTGYCPEPDSWPAVARALDEAGIGHPAAFTNAYQFRLCTSCRMINIIKDDWYECGVCGVALPSAWNFALTRNASGLKTASTVTSLQPLLAAGKPFPDDES